MIVRTDLPSKEQILVQASHACYEAGHFFHPSGAPHPNFVVIGVPDEESLVRENSLIKAVGISTQLFAEPNIENQFTALATEPISGDQRRFFRKYRLLKLKETT